MAWSQPFLMTLGSNERDVPISGTPGHGTETPGVRFVRKNLGPGNLNVGPNSVPPGRFIYVAWVGATLTSGANGCAVEVTFADG